MKTCEEMTACVLRRIGEHKSRQARRRKTAAAVITPLCAVLLAVLIGFGIGKTTEPEGVTLKGPEITSSENTLMLPFFIYDGGFYRPCGTDADQNIAGEHLGYATGTVDEWTPKSGYVNYSGSSRGNIYAVNGFDPSFLLCLKEQDGSLTLYVNNHGYTLKTGKDLFETRLHLNGHVTEASCRAAGEESGEQPLDGAKRETVNIFLKKLCKAPFAYQEAITQTPFLSDKAVGYLHFETDHGFSVTLTLYEGGYVMLQGLRGVCVAMEPEDFDKITALLQ